MVAAILGTKARLGHVRGGREEDDKDREEAAERKRKTMITAASFDRQVRQDGRVLREGLRARDQEARRGRPL